MRRHVNTSPSIVPYVPLFYLFNTQQCVQATGKTFNMVPKSHLLRPFTNSRAALCPAVSVYKRALFTSPTRRYYHSSPPWQQDVSAQTSQHRAGNPVAESMRASATPTGNPAAAPPQPDDPNRNTAFLGEADSDDGFEADVAANPEAHRHHFTDVSASGLHGQSGESPS